MAYGAGNASWIKCRAKVNLTNKHFRFSFCCGFIFARIILNLWMWIMWDIFCVYLYRHSHIVYIINMFTLDERIVDSKIQNKTNQGEFFLRINAEKNNQSWCSISINWLFCNCLSLINWFYLQFKSHTK